MTDPFMGLAPSGVMLGGPAPSHVNDNAEAAAERADGFYGLLLRRKDDSFEIVLCHRNPDRSQRVETVYHDDDIIALWRSIGRKVNLPLLAETAGGEIVQIEPSPWMSALPRRGGSALTYRRPRFLARRKVGDKVAVPVAERDVQAAL